MAQKHHITYEPEWIVELNGWQHKAITTMQRSKATPQNYAKAIGFLHAVMYEVNRMRQQLDVEDKE